MPRITIEIMKPTLPIFSHVDSDSFERYIAKGIDTKRKINWRITIEIAEPRVSMA
jgi:hypothetical protein